MRLGFQTMSLEACKNLPMVLQAFPDRVIRLKERSSDTCVSTRQRE